MIKRTLLAMLTAIALIFGFSSAPASAYTYFSTRICYPMYSRDPGTWMKISAWTDIYGRKVYHFSFRESEDYNGTGWMDVRFGSFTGTPFRYSSPYDNNPTDRYITLNNHWYEFTAVWRVFWMNLPVGNTDCTLWR